jgi:CRP/FNR family cyclic AMP-dependent transcriptional regulator
MTSLFKAHEGAAARAARGHAAGGARRCSACATRSVCMIGALPQSGAGIGPAARERSFRQGEMLSREGETATHVRILKVGTAFLCRDGDAHPCRPIALVASGSVFGLFGALALPSEVSAVAASSGHFCEISRERMQSLARNHEGFHRVLHRACAAEVGALAAWAQVLGRRGPAQVASALLLMADNQRTSRLTIPAHTALAELLGTTRESVARAFAALEAAQCLTRAARHRCEVHVEALRAWLAAQAARFPTYPPRADSCAQRPPAAAAAAPVRCRRSAVPAATLP